MSAVDYEARRKRIDEIAKSVGPENEPIKVQTGGRDLVGSGYSDEGYGWMENAGHDGWKAVSGWGADGWDLGDWPYVIYMVRERIESPGTATLSQIRAKDSLAAEDHLTVFELASYCEGDCRIETYDNVHSRQAAIDQAFIWHVLHNGGDSYGLEDEVAEILSTGVVPERLTGPYRSGR